jgi:uncharacterized protein with FMN-binding domain
MKRALLIAGGTVGGLGAVLSITPPQFTSQEAGVAIGGASAMPASTTTTDATPAATQSAAAVKTTAATATKNATATKSATPVASATAAATKSATPTASATPSATKTTAAPTTKNVSGSFTGDAVNVGYGIVQVQITVSNGKITDAQAISAPSGRNDRWTQMSVPVLRQKTLAAQGSNITGVSGASYTSYGWWKSLVSALSKAGL